MAAPVTRSTEALRQYLSEPDEKHKERFMEKVSMKSTDELLAMVRATQEKEAEIERSIRQRREETSKAAYAQRWESLRTKEEDPTMPTVAPPASSSAPQGEPHQEAEDGGNQDRVEEPSSAAPVAVALNTTGSAVSNVALPSISLNPAAVAGPKYEAPSHADRPALQSNPSVPLAAAKVPTRSNDTASREAAGRDEATIQKLTDARQQAEARAAELSVKVEGLTTQLASSENNLSAQSVQIAELQARINELTQSLTESQEENKQLCEQLTLKEDLRARARTSQPISKEELLEIQTSISVQDKIIATLETDNQKLLTENKNLLQKMRESEQSASTTEAKQSLLASQSHPRADPTNFENMRVELEKKKTELAELQLQLDRANKERSAAERRLATVDWTRIEDAELQMRNLRVEHERKAEEHTVAMEEMARKIAWYVEHQEFNRAQEDLIKEQQDSIAALKLKVLELESFVARDRKGSQRPATDKEKLILQLQKRVLELEEAIRERNPNSIAELIRACRPPPNESQVVKELTAKMELLKGQLQQQEQEAQRSLDRLRVESDAMRVQYQQRVEKMEEEMRIRLISAQSRKVKELEKQIFDAKRYYSEKIREQEQIILALRRGQPHEKNARGTSAKVAKTKDDTTQKPLAVHSSNDNGLNEDTNERPCGIPAGQQEAKTQQEDPATVGPRPPRAVAAATTSPERVAAEEYSARPDTLRALRELQEVIRARDAEIGALRMALGEARRTQQHPSTSGIAATLQLQLEGAYEELAMQRRLLREAQEAQRQAHIMHEERLSAVKRDFQREADHMRQEHQASMEEARRKIHDAERMAASTPREILTVPDVVSGSSKGSGKAVNKFLQLVRERLWAMEQQQASKEREYQRVLDEVRRMANFELNAEREKMDLLVRHKNTEIESYRAQLDELLVELASLRTGPLLPQQQPQQSTTARPSS